MGAAASRMVRGMSREGRTFRTQFGIRKIEAGRQRDLFLLK